MLMALLEIATSETPSHLAIDLLFSFMGLVIGLSFGFGFGYFVGGRRRK